MKRVLLSAMSALLVAMFIGLTGCDSGGIEPGVPTNVTVPPDAAAKMKEMANMAGGATPPPSVKKVPEKGTDPGGAAPVEKDKETPK